MPRYLSADTLRGATQRLIESRAKSGFVDFLVLKRALVRARADEIPFSSTDPEFTGAMGDLAATYPRGIPHASPARFRPFVKVFGTAGAEKYVTKKWLTNGPADTLSGRNWTSDVVRIDGRKPRRGSLMPGHAAHLANLLLKAGGRLPALVDAAIWYHRGDDVDAMLGTAADAADLGERLCRSFTERLGLTDAETAALFETEPQSQAEALGAPLRDTVADPQEYLPDLDSGNAELDGMIAAFDTLANSRDVGLSIGRDLLLRSAAALGAKRFLILGGLAGSGKTKLAQAFARWLTPVPEEGQLPAYAVIPVGADWTGTESILGYPDGLDPTRYVTRPALELMQRASQPENLDAPHFLILDEMNLSHVERYFADLLSMIETDEAVELYRPKVNAAGEPELRDGAGPTLRLPRNLFIIGTVNVDETTYMFSPKVLDRANVIEFRMSREELKSFLAAPGSPVLDELGGRGASFGTAFVRESHKSLTCPPVLRSRFEAEALLFFDLLREHNAEFGFRVANEAARFIHFYKLLGALPDENPATFDAAMDAVIVQKLLPKLHGSRPKLEGLLWSLTWACGAARPNDPEEFVAQCHEAGLAQDEVRYSPEAVLTGLGGGPARYPLSLEKLIRMWRKLVRDQFVTFFEA